MKARMKINGKKNKDIKTLLLILKTWPKAETRAWKVAGREMNITILALFNR